MIQAEALELKVSEKQKNQKSLTLLDLNETGLGFGRSND